MLPGGIDAQSLEFPANGAVGLRDSIPAQATMPSPQDFAGTQQAVYAWLAEEREDEALRAAQACADWYATLPAIHLRYAGFSGAFINMLMDAGADTEAQQLATRLFNQVVSHQGYAGLLTSGDLRAIGRGLDTSISNGQRNRIEELALDKLERNRDHRSMALTELAELRELGQELDLDPVKRDADTLWRQTLDGAKQGDITLAPFELHELMRQFRRDNNAGGQESVASFLVDDYLTFDGPGRVLRSEEWLALARLAKGQADTALNQRLLDTIADRLELDPRFGLVGGPGELAAWLNLIDGLDASAEMVAGTFIGRSVGLPVAWERLDPTLQKALLEAARGQWRSLRTTAAASPGSISGGAVERDACLVLAGRYWGQREVAAAAIDRLAATVFTEQTGTDLEPKTIELAVTVLAGGQQRLTSDQTKQCAVWVASWDDDPAARPDALYRAAATLLRSRDGIQALQSHQSEDLPYAHNLAVAKVQAWSAQMGGDLRAFILELQTNQSQHEDVALSRHLLALGYASSLYDPEKPRLQGVFTYLPQAIAAAEDDAAARVLALQEFAAACLANGYTSSAHSTLTARRESLGKDHHAALDPWIDRLAAQQNHRQTRKAQREPWVAMQLAMQSRQHQLNRWTFSRPEIDRP